MGLPMFREPDEAIAEQAAAKLDHVAATRRSTIRRESSIRPHRQSSGDGARLSPRSANDHRVRRMIRMMVGEDPDLHSLPPLRHLDDSMSSIEAQIQDLRRDQLERPLDRLRDRLLQPIDNARDRVTIERLDPDFIEVMDHFRSHADTPIPLIDTDYAFGEPTSNMQDTVSQNLPRPSRESGLRFEVVASPHPESDTTRRRRLRPHRTSQRERGLRSPHRSRSPYSLAVQGSAGDDDVQDSAPNSAALTPGFAPAHGPLRPLSRAADDQPFQDVDVTPVWATRFSPDTPALDRDSSSYPALRRVNHLSPRPINSGPRVDGLGDRMMSPSPSSDSHEEENWNALLTSIPPGRASNATSFMSSRSDSRTESQRSSQAATSATSFGEIGADESCDLDLPFGITYDQVREIRASHGRGPRPAPSRLTDSRSLDAFRRQLDRPRDQPRPGSQSRESLSPGTDELRVFSDILQRMQRREEVPDGMWAAVGLSPDVVRSHAI
ncbi:hypothetical protein B0A52_08541 [Exophiala mesophila]|uniref:Uncharacterized protein n=1 Tax=Exophiala mesophila TaxID=212818 RepID=A0A438MYD9_EXOME|nr:hypothetical protein B0A52_08541 [Exophiala mesophila]